MNSTYQQIQFKLERAEQLLLEIFPHTEDPRIFLSILSLLQNITEELIQIIQQHTLTPQNTNNNYQSTLLNQLKTIQSHIQNLLSTHHSCPTEINTKDHIIMYTNEFQQKTTINKNDIQNIIIQIKQIIQNVNNQQK